MKTKSKYLFATLLLLCSTMVFAVYDGSLTSLFESPESSQLEVKRTYSLCIYQRDINSDSVEYRFAAYAYNVSSEAYAGNINLKVRHADETTSVYNANISVAPADSTYFKIYFPVRHGEKVFVSVADANDVAISDEYEINIPEEDIYPSRMENILFKTVYALSEDNVPVFYDSDTTKCGENSITYGVTILEGSNSLLPQEGTAFASISDVYGISYNSFNFDLSDIFHDAEDSKSTINAKTKTFPIGRGGIYEYIQSLNCFGIYKKDTLTIYEEPTLRFEFPADVVTGKDIYFEAQYNTGYPYSEEVKTRTYGSIINVTYLKPVAGQELDTIRDFRVENHSTNFDIEHYPLLAGVDTFKLDMEKPELGEYLINFGSEYREGKRNFVFSTSVKDTLRMEMTLQNNTFTKGVDSIATIHYKLDKKWPYILNLMCDSIPSVHIVPSFIHFENNMTKSDSLMCDSLFALVNHDDSVKAQAIIDSLVGDHELINDSLIVQIGHNMPLDIEGDFSFNMGKCPVGDSLQLKVYIRNIESMDILNKFSFCMNETPTGIISIDPSEAEDRNRDLRKYNLQGLPVDDNYRGIVVRRGKAYLNK